MSALTDETDEAPLGYHKGKPILSESATIRKGARVLSDTMEVAPFAVDPAGEIFLSMLVHQESEKFDNVMSQDDPELLLGYHRVVIFDALGAVPDDRAGTAKAIAAMRARVADEAERKRKEKGGQMRLAGVQPVPAEDEDPGDTGKVREIRSGVPDDEGAGEPAGE